MRSLEEIESTLDSVPSYSVEDVQQMISSDEKGVNHGDKMYKNHAQKMYNQCTGQAFW